jgi:hypothetical protein
VGRHYSAFLIRHWRLGDDGTQRIEVVHIQSDTHALLTSLQAAAEWIAARAAGRTPLPAAPDGPAGAPGEPGPRGD